ncbi:MAG: DUF262 domain-containing protein [Methanosarcinales archaeon]|nr:DUF262 domain-containing protein [Methanosarcinales archaeon]
MPFETPITIKESIDNIHKKKYLLPAIQREVVWKTKQIERLFDSLIRDYPIGSFLFWHVEKEKRKEYQFYEFMRNYHERDNRHNPKADVSGDGDVTAILDGQQRLTSLYIGLKGTYAYKLPKKWWDNPSAFPERKLYLNLLRKSDDIDLEYDFRFLTDEKAEYRDKNSFWFRVGDILNIHEEFEVNDYLIENNILGLDKENSRFANRTLFKLHSIVHKDGLINYYLEKDQDLDKVLNIFIRVNSGGTQLSHSDLLLSIATAQWQKKDAREEIIGFVDEINNIGGGFNFDKDFVLKTCLVLSDFGDIAFKVRNFNKENMLTIEINWDRISEAMRLAITLVSSFGYTRDTLTSNNAVIPISYHLLRRGLPHNFVQSSNYIDERNQVHKWLILSLLKRTFSGQPDNVLRRLRQVLSEQNSSFPLTKIVEKLKGGTKSIVFNDDEIENLFYYRYGQSYTFSALALLYPSLDFRNKFHQDHIFPKTLFTNKRLIERGITEQNKVEFYLNNFNYLANLQLLEGIPNQEKSDMDFEEWLYRTCPIEQERKDYMNKHYIPDIDLSFDNFENFITDRKKLMANKFKSLIELDIVQVGNHNTISQ